jgi:hypothetical protein
MKVQDLFVGAGPKLHTSGGIAHSWQVSDEILVFIDEHVTAESQTLETGAGVTTVLFAMKKCHHTCVVPFHEEVERIKSFCTEQGVSHDRIDFVVERSEVALPQLQFEPLDLVLIDGAHGFPVPLLDWYFTADRLRVGGRLVLDDTQLWSVNVLKQFLMHEPEWRLERDIPPRNAIFAKVREGSCAKNEMDQPFVVNQTIHLLFPDYLYMIREYVPHQVLTDRERHETKTSPLRVRVRLIAKRVLPDRLVRFLGRFRRSVAARIRRQFTAG